MLKLGRRSEKKGAYSIIEQRVYSEYSYLNNNCLQSYVRTYDIHFKLEGTRDYMYIISIMNRVVCLAPAQEEGRDLF